DMTVSKRPSNACTYRAATIFAGETRAPDVCCLCRNDRGNTSFRRLRIFAIVTKLGLETDEIAERLPEFLFERRSRHHSAVLGGIEAITGRAAGDVTRSISRPSARNETLADRPEHEREQIVRHRHIEVAPAPRPATLLESQ